MVVPGVDPGIGCPDAGVDVTRVVVKPHVLLLLGCGGPPLRDNKLSFKLKLESAYYRDVLQGLDRVGAVGPAVGVDDSVGDALALTLYGLPEVLLAGQHHREHDEERKCDLEWQ